MLKHACKALRNKYKGLVRVHFPRIRGKTPFFAAPSLYPAGKIPPSMDDRIPLSAALYVEGSVNTTKFSEDAPVRPSGKHRWAYTSQLLLARKFGEGFSAQLTPTYVHRNLVPLTADENDTYALGAGASIRLTKGVSLNLDYFYRFNDDQTESFDPIAIGVDIETGGHVFQLHFTNARQMSARGYLTETTGDFFEGSIHFGFNLNRVFQVGGDKEKKQDW